MSRLNFDCMFKPPFGVQQGHHEKFLDVLNRSCNSLSLQPFPVLRTHYVGAAVGVTTSGFRCTCFPVAESVIVKSRKSTVSQQERSGLFERFEKDTQRAVSYRRFQQVWRSKQRRRGKERPGHEIDFSHVSRSRLRREKSV